ncbi:MAG: hypothetical protein ACK559_22375, partial [bacterium]
MGGGPGRQLRHAVRRAVGGAPGALGGSAIHSRRARRPGGRPRDAHGRRAGRWLGRRRRSGMHRRVGRRQRRAGRRDRLLGVPLPLGVRGWPVRLGRAQRRGPLRPRGPGARPAPRWSRLGRPRAGCRPTAGGHERSAGGPHRGHP